MSRAALTPQPRSSRHTRGARLQPAGAPCACASPAMRLPAVLAPPEPRPAERGRGRHRDGEGVAFPHSSSSSSSGSPAGGAGAARWRREAPKLCARLPARPGVAQGAGAARRRVRHRGLPALAAMERKGERRGSPAPVTLRRAPAPHRSPLLSPSAGAAGPEEADQSQERQGPEEVSAAPGSPQSAAPAAGPGAASRRPRRLFVAVGPPHGKGLPSAGESRVLPGRRSVRTPQGGRVLTRG